MKGESNIIDHGPQHPVKIRGNRYKPRNSAIFQPILNWPSRSYLVVTTNEAIFFAFADNHLWINAPTKAKYLKYLKNEKLARLYKNDIGK